MSAPEPPFSDQDRPLSDRPLAAGAAAIGRVLSTLASVPGVYRMLDDEGRVLYVGKAKDLRKRVAAYVRPERHSIRIQRMIARTRSMEVVTTHTEAEALLLEANLIKRLKPRYNILLRDDKSFPSILVTGDHPFPQVLKHRGARSRKGQYFGPFASAWAVNRTLEVLQRAFLLRTCSDAVLAGRTRPCLLYQIKRCSAPCTGLINEPDYAALVEQARDFLRGKSDRIRDELAAKMDAAAETLDFETAARYRDRLRAMALVRAHQDINVPNLGDADVVAAHAEGGQTCVQVFFIRGGGNYGNRAYFPSHGADADPGEVLEAFLGQFYAAHPPPPLVLLGGAVPNRAVLAEALSTRAEAKVAIEVPSRGPKRKLAEHARANAREALARRLAEDASQRRLLDALGAVLGLDGPPTRIEIYDNSHVQGANPVGAMVVAGPEGFARSAYRKFNIRGAFAPGDDYAMMAEVLRRRFARIGEDDAPMPDLVLIDGGKGQLGVAMKALEDLGVTGVAVAAIAKGPDRNAGRERIFLPDRPVVQLDPNDPVLYFLQRLRDEAHRFAIGSHRTRRKGDVTRSPLDEVAGVGAARKRALLRHFGTAAEVARAGFADLAAVPGISRATARRIYDHFHPGGPSGS